MRSTSRPGPLGESQAEADSFDLPFVATSVSNEALVNFTKNFAVMVGARLSLVEALDTARAQTEDERLRSILAQVTRRVRRGRDLSDSLQGHEDVFGRLYVHLVRVGERAGILSEMLRQLARYLKRRREIRRKVRLAFVYPGLVLAIAFGATVFLLTAIVPTFADLFAEFDAELPGATQAVLAVSEALTSHYLLVGGAIAVLALSLRAFLWTATGRWLWDTVRLRAPLFGPLYRKGLTAQVCRTLGTLLRNGVALDEALEVQLEAAENTHLRTALEGMLRSVRRGDPLAEPVSRADLFPEMVVQMVQVGEETAELANMLLQAAEHYEEEARDTAQTLTSVLEPILIVVIGFVLGAILIALYLPMFDMMNVVR
jgi:type IV pilus assembly protein PilC